MSQGTDFSASWIHYPAEPIALDPAGGGGGVLGNRSRNDGHRVKLFEESVTFIAQLEGAGMVPPLDRTWMIGSWRVPDYQIPVIIGVSSGVLILLLTVAILIIWRCCCCRYSKHKLDEKAHKDYPHLEDGRSPVLASPISSSSFPSMSVSSMSKPSSPALTSRSQLVSISTSNTVEMIRFTAPTPTQQRQEEADGTADGTEGKQLGQQEKKTTASSSLLVLSLGGERRSCDDMSQLGLGGYVGFDLPDCPDSLNASSSCASSSALDAVPWAGGSGQAARHMITAALSNEPELKTRSLPSWARNKGLRSAVHQQPSSPNGHNHHAGSCQKVMNACQELPPPDRVSLVSGSQRDAVILFNERTAL